MSESLVGRLAVQSKRLIPGEAVAFELKTGELLQIMTMQGKQVADFVAIASGNASEVLSTAVTRSRNNSIMLKEGDTLYSNLRNPLFEISDDTVGRHDTLMAACDPQRYKDDFGIDDHDSCRVALATELKPHGITLETVPDPVNWFMNVAILQRGELEIREPLAEANDHVVLLAKADVVVAVSACPQDQNETNAFKPTDLLLRVFR